MASLALEQKNRNLGLLALAVAAAMLALGYASVPLLEREAGHHWPPTLTMVIA